MFFKIIGYDLKRGILCNFKGNMLTILLGLLISISFVCEYSKDYNLCTAHSIDVIFFAFAGTPKYIPGKDIIFVFPLIWATVFLLPLYLTSYYPFYDLMGYGKTILIQSGSRIKWWLSKSVWCILRIFTFFLTIYLVVIIFCLVMEIPINYNVTENTYNMMIDRYYKADAYLPGDYTLLEFDGNMGPLFLILPVLIISVMSLIQLAVSLLSTPVYGFILSAIILVASTYYLNPLLIGNYLMVFRSDRLFYGGVNDIIGTLVSLILIVFVTIINIFLFRKYDVVLNAFKDE